MKIASSVFKTRATIAENLVVMKEQMVEAKNNGADMILFSECQLSGFRVGANVIHDRKLARSVKDNEILEICALAQELQLAVGLGFLELKDGGFYDSYAIIEKKGTIREVYRRLTKTWHEDVRGNMYCEGESIYSLVFDGVCFSILLCGDLFDDVACAMVNATDCDICFIPMARSFGHKATQAEWEKEEKEYIKQLSKLNTNALFVNQYMEEGDYFGGVSAICMDGTVESRLSIYTEGIHYLEF